MRTGAGSGSGMTTGADAGGAGSAGSAKPRGYVEADLSRTEQEIFEKLHWWRVEKKVREHNVPAYIVFHDADYAGNRQGQTGYAGCIAGRVRVRAEESTDVRRKDRGAGGSVVGGGVSLEEGLSMALCH